jgi:23S rRNA (uracil1939-C5)-methyltransferase
MEDKTYQKPEQGGRIGGSDPDRTLRVEGIVAGGLGFVVDNGKRVYVPGGLPDDVVRIGLVDDRDGGAYAEIVETVSFGIDRREPPCSHADICGGCQWQVLAYADQLSLKRAMVESSFVDRGVRIDVPDVLPSPSELRYRDRVDYAFGPAPDGSLALGLHGVETGVFPVEDCQLQSVAANETRRRLGQALAATRLRPYDETRRTGVLRGLVVREADENRLATLVVSSDKHIPIETLHEATQGDGLVVHVNRRRSRHAIPKSERVVTGEGWLHEVRSGLRLRVSPRTFTQVNSAQSERLCEIAINAAAISPGDRVVDLYCGVGILSMLSAKAGASVLGVELSESTVEDARHNLTLNEIEACAICLDDADGGIWQASVDGPVDSFLINPPRAGIERGVVDRVCAHTPERIIYVSCNPVTLARDVQRFRRAGYHIKAVQPVDMFPQTVHIEVIATLVRGG